jgi:hypothetical protein
MIQDVQPAATSPLTEDKETRVGNNFSVLETDGNRNQVSTSAIRLPALSDA